MHVLFSSRLGVEIQLGFWDALLDMLRIEPIFLLGVVLIGIACIAVFRKDSSVPKIITILLSLILYYYLCVMLTHIVGIPTLNEYRRLARLGEAFFHPHINPVPFSDGLSLSFILNVFLFIPFGFLCPLISRTFARARNTLFIGFGLSLLIEIVQLFTLYRAMDVNDLLTNVFGAMIGYLCFRLIAKPKIGKRYSHQASAERDATAYLPVVIIIVTFVLGFFS